MDPLSGLRTVVGDPDAGWAAADGQPRPDPLGGGRGEPDLFAASPGAGALELLEHPRPLGELDVDPLAATVEHSRERMRAHEEAAYLHLWADAARAHLHALPVRAGACGARAGALQRVPRAHPGPQPPGRPAAGRGARPRARGVGRARARWRCARSPPQAPFHVQLLPRAERARFEDDGPSGADTMHDVLQRMTSLALGAAPALGAHGATRGHRFCWRIEIVPAAGPADGLEAGAGVHLTALAPEDAAERLRGALR